MTTSSRRAASVVVAILALAVSPAAFAQQPSAADLESARELYKEGKALRDRGDLRGALERFKQAHAYGQTPVTGLELGRTHAQLLELVEAREVLLSVARMKVASDETEKSTAARNEAADLAEQIRARIPTLVVKITGVPVGTDAQVSIDGAALPMTSLETTRKTNPGTHAVVARVGTHEEKRSVDLKEGESKDVAIAFDPSSAPQPLPTIPPPPVETPKSARSISVVTWIGLGVGVAGLGVGSVAGILALGKSSTVKNECTGLSCPADAKHDVDSGRTMATVSTIGFIVGAAGLATAAVGYFLLSPSTSAKSGSTLSVRAVTAGSWVGLDGTF